MARELEPLPAAWSEMSIHDALHLLHLPETASVTATGLRESLENALEHAKFDEIPVLLGAYRMLEGHFGTPEGAGTRQDDPTSASWPVVSGRAVELDPWEDDPSITVSDVRLIEPGNLTTPKTLQPSSTPWLRPGAGEADHDPQRIVIDDFSAGALDGQASHGQASHGQASHVRRAPHVVRMQPADGAPRVKHGLSIPGLLAVAIAGLLVVWAYHPWAQGLVATMLGQTAQTPVVATPPVTESSAGAINTTPELPSAGMPAVPSEVTADSGAPIKRAAESLMADAGATATAVKATANQPVTGPNLQADTNKPNPSQMPATGMNKTVTIKPAPKTTVSADRKTKQVTPVGLQARKVQTHAAKPKASAFNASQSIRTSPSPKPRVTQPQPNINAVQKTTQKAIQAVKDVVSRVPITTESKPLRVSNQTVRTPKISPRIAKATPKIATPKTASIKTDTSITNPIKLASNNELDAAAARAIANPQPVVSIQAPKSTGKIDNLSREEFGQRYFNRKLFEVWQRDGAKLRYGTWDEVPLELQILENALFRSAIYLDGPSPNEAKDNENPLQP
jgi:hypothetical protein